MPEGAMMIPEMRAWIRATVKLWTIFISILFCTLIFQLWVLAFYNGDSVVVYIDLYGEKWIELVIWVIAVPILAYGLIGLLRQQLREARMARLKYYRKTGKVVRL